MVDINQGKEIQARLLQKTSHTQEIVKTIADFYTKKGEKAVNIQDVIKAASGILSNYEFTQEKFPSELRRIILEEINKLDQEERVYTLGRIIDIFLYSALIKR
jgi:hypothetical protein